MFQLDTEITLRQGIGNLFNERKSFEEFLEMVLHNSVAFAKHPFDLDATKCIVDGSEAILVGHPGGTDESVDSMMTVLRCVLSLHHHPTDPIPVKLRIIREPFERDPSRTSGFKHWVWFEASWRQGTFFCGGCNDFSGGGGRGRSTLESTFVALSKLELFSLTDVSLPYVTRNTAYDRVFAAVHADEDQKRSA